MNRSEFYISTLGGDGHDSHATISELIKNSEIEAFVAKFVNGLVHQGHFQTGHDRPVGETTATRIAHDVLALMEQCKGEPISFDFASFHSKLNLGQFSNET